MFQGDSGNVNKQTREAIIFGFGKPRIPRGMEEASKSYTHSGPPDMKRLLAKHGEKVSDEASIPKGSLKGTGAGFAGSRVNLESGGWYEHTVVVLPGPRNFTNQRITLVCRNAKSILNVGR